MYTLYFDVHIIFWCTQNILMYTLNRIHKFFCTMHTHTHTCLCRTKYLQILVDYCSKLNMYIFCNVQQILYDARTRMTVSLIYFDDVHIYIGWLAEYGSDIMKMKIYTFSKCKYFYTLICMNSRLPIGRWFSWWWSLFLWSLSEKYRRNCTLNSLVSEMIQNTVTRLCVVCLLQSVAVCCSILQCVAVCCILLQCVAVCGSVLQCVSAWEFVECYLDTVARMSEIDHTSMDESCLRRMNESCHFYMIEHFSATLLSIRIYPWKLVLRKTLWADRI